MTPVERAVSHVARAQRRTERRLARVAREIRRGGVTRAQAQAAIAELESNPLNALVAQAAIDELRRVH